MEVCLLGFMAVKKSKLLREYKPQWSGDICCFCMAVVLV
jgi:hypothetical protein